MPEGFSFIIQNESSLRCAYSLAFPWLKKSCTQDFLSVLFVAIGVFTFVSWSNFTGQSVLRGARRLSRIFHPSTFTLLDDISQERLSFCVENKTVKWHPGVCTVLVYLSNFRAGRNRVHCRPHTVRGA